MASSAITTKSETIADLLERLGGISPDRVRAHPAPGQATVDDVIAIEHHEKRRFELIDGALVEKAMGFRESLLALFLANALTKFVDAGNLGLVSGSDGMVRLFAGLVLLEMNTLSRPSGHCAGQSSALTA